MKNSETFRRNGVKRGFSMKPMAIIALSYLLAILLGSIILFLPFLRKDGATLSYIDSLFVSASSICVTGLIPLKNGIYGVFNPWGQGIIALFIQIGGLGIATLGVSIYMIGARKLSFKQQSLIKDSRNLSTFKSLKFVFFSIISLNILIETISACLIYLDFAYVNPISSLADQGSMWGNSVFLSISAYNNSGIDLFGSSSLISFKDDIFLQAILIVELFLGGIGYLVIIDILNKRFNFRRLSFQTKMVLSVSLSLVLFGFVSLFLSEYITGLLSNEFGSSDIGMVMQESLFLSFSSRTSGFTTIDLFSLRNASLLIIIFLMFVGASPGGTGGGIKTTTFYVVVLSLIATFQKKPPHGFNRTVSKKVVKRAMTLFISAIMIVFVGSLLVVLFEYNDNAVVVNGGEVKNFGYIDYLFECMSSFSNTGLSTGYTPYFTIGSKLTLIILMYLGRIGPLSFSKIVNKKDVSRSYAEGEISIG